MTQLFPNLDPEIRRELLDQLEFIELQLVEILHRPEGAEPWEIQALESLRRTVMARAALTAE